MSQPPMTKWKNFLDGGALYIRKISAAEKTKIGQARIPTRDVSFYFLAYRGKARDGKQPHSPLTHQRCPHPPFHQGGCPSRPKLFALTQENPLTPHLRGYRSQAKSPCSPEIPPKPKKLQPPLGHPYPPPLTNCPDLALSHFLFF